LIKFEFDGKPFNPQNFTETLLKAAMESVAEEIHQKVCAIRHPDTGEFPTVIVSGTSLEDMSLRIEGSPELLELVNERLGVTTDNDHEIETEAAVIKSLPKVFLSYAWEDKELASKIAHTLQAKGIDTWWDEWCMSAGDSLRQKIDEGLSDCTHFVVLLTPVALTKPWVNQEMDAGLMLKLKSRAKFIPLRSELQVDQLPPLLQGMVSPYITGPDYDISQLVADIHEVTKKPALGVAPKPITESMEASIRYSAAANAVAKVFVQKSTHARKFDPWLELNELGEETGLSADDIYDAIHELSGMVTEHHDSFHAEDELFATFDRYWMPWDPAQDALKLATDMLNIEYFPTEPESIGEKYGWNPRRLNPALAYLVNRKIVNDCKALDGSFWLLYQLQKTAATRRFVKSRS